MLIMKKWSLVLHHLIIQSFYQPPSFRLHDHKLRPSRFTNELDRAFNYIWGETCPHIHWGNNQFIKMGNVQYMKLLIADITSGWNEQLMKWPVDEMTSWWNDQLMKWPVDEMTSWWNDQLMKWPVDEMTSWSNDQLIKWPVDQMT
jgi:hypothetical protein